MTTPPTPLLIAAGVIVLMLARAAWATFQFRMTTPAEREYDMPRVSWYVNASVPQDEQRPARAWADLDMDDVFRKLDRTVGWPGQHLLYARLRTEHHSPADLARLEGQVFQATADGGLRTRLRMALAPLDARRASALPFLFYGELPQRPPLAWMYPLLSMAGVISVVAAFRWPGLILLLGGLGLLNACLRAWHRDRIDRVVPAMRMLPAMLGAATSLTLLEGELKPHATELRHALPKLHWMSRAAWWLSFEPTGANELVNFVYELVNLLFLLDVTAYAWSVDALVQGRDTLRSVYVALGELDTVQSLATLRSERSDWSRPSFCEGVECGVDFSGLKHPLLHDAVPNALTMLDRSVLLTGSNMSGKSTFIRAVGVNAVLAQTIHTVFAERWRSPRMAVRTSIGRADSILEGKSYYRAEVDGIGALLTATPGHARLILIDELFRGTNSVERVSAAKAVLAHLDAGEDFIIVATHDVELLDLLPGYAAYHFREEVRDGELTFDYRLHGGPCSTKNAIAILELAGYPAGVVAEARAQAAAMGKNVATE
ncbi:MAG: hypothetical protein JWM95_3562 [Gemmatimonadetes bacterium]|nr:hypothetical protein [Gemmatimonadota bacterium]